MYIYAIYDKKLGEYGPNLQVEKNQLGMLRNLSDVLQKIPEGQLAKHAEDFDVMCLGEFDEETGVITPIPTPRFVENVGNLTRHEVPPVKGIGVMREA